MRFKSIEMSGPEQAKIHQRHQALAAASGGPVAELRHQIQRFIEAGRIMVSKSRRFHLAASAPSRRGEGMLNRDLFRAVKFVEKLLAVLINPIGHQPRAE